VPGLELREMEKSGKTTFCCGAGGGRMWMEETRGTRINAERTRQALETGAATVATSCPFCMVMMKDGLADAAATTDPGSPGPGAVSARDIAEILADVIEPDPVPAGRRLPVLQ
jgi:Fe-S oxidoreductase